MCELARNDPAHGPKSLCQRPPRRPAFRFIKHLLSITYTLVGSMAWKWSPSPFSLTVRGPCADSYPSNLNRLGRPYLTRFRDLGVDRVQGQPAPEEVHCGESWTRPASYLCSSCPIHGPSGNGRSLSGFPGPHWGPILLFSIALRMRSDGFRRLCFRTVTVYPGPFTALTRVRIPPGTPIEFNDLPEIFASQELGAVPSAVKMT